MYEVYESILIQRPGLVSIVDSFSNPPLSAGFSNWSKPKKQRKILCWDLCSEVKSCSGVIELCICAFLRILFTTTNAPRMSLLPRNYEEFCVVLNTAAYLSDTGGEKVTLKIWRAVSCLLLNNAFYISKFKLHKKKYCRVQIDNQAPQVLNREHWLAKVVHINKMVRLYASHWCICPH